MTIPPEELAKMHRQRTELTDKIGQMFSEIDDKRGDIIGAVLGELFAIWLSGHRPGIRDEVRKSFNQMVDGLIPVMDEARRNTKQRKSH